MASLLDTSAVEATEGDVGAKIREWSTLIGIVTAIVGNILISFALNIQRYAHIRLGREQEENNQHWSDDRKSNGHKNYGTQQAEIAEERAKVNLNAPGDEQAGKDQDGNATSDHDSTDHEGSIRSRSSSESTITQSEKINTQEDRKSYLKSPYWWAGIVLMILGEAGNFIAYGFAPASIVSPLGVVALVSNCVIAPVLLKEHFRLRDFLGVVVAIAGAVTIVLSAKNSEVKMGPDDVWAAITRWEFETYLGITTVLIISLMWASGKYGEKTVLIDLGLVGLFGGYTALSTKGVASLLSDTLWRTLTFPVTYLLVFILVATALLQIRYVNRALQHFDSTQVIPIQFVLFTISVIIGSAVLYRDFQSADASRFGKFFGGCALTFVGVYLITSARANGGDEQEHDVLGDEENAIGMVDEERYQDEVDDHGNEEGMRRKSSVSFAANTSTTPRSSRRTSGQQGSKSPCTPPPLLSYTTSASSRFSEPDSPIPEDPREASRERFAPGRPQPLESTISSPLLPSQARHSDPPSTPHAQPSQGRLSVSKAGRPSALSRTSMARLTPGPLLSPLSSPLSAVVADNLRRGMDSPSARRRPGLGLLNTKSQRGVRSSTSGEVLTASSPRTARPFPEEVPQDERPPTAGRSQSVSATLGEFFRLKRERSKGKATDHDNDTQQ